MVKKSAKPIYIILGAILIALMVGFAWLLTYGNLNRSTNHPIKELDSGWEILRNGERLKEDTLTALDTGKVYYGEVFSLHRTLPEDAEELPSATLYFRNLHGAVRVLLEEEVIYTSGVENYESGRFVGRYLCFVPLPKDYAGKEITITMRAAEKNSFYGLGPIYFGNAEDLFLFFFKERQVPLFIASFLSVFGVVQLLWLPLLLHSDKQNIKLFFSALTSLIIGFYLMGYYNLFDLFVFVENLNTMMEYLSLYTMAMVMCGYMASIHEGSLKHIYVFLTKMDMILVITAILLHFLNLVHITQWLIASYFLSYMEALPYLWYALRGGRKRRETYFDHLEGIADLVLAGGLLAYVFGSFVDAILFTKVKLTGGQEATARIPYLTAGSVIFALAMCLHYLLVGVINVRMGLTRQTLMDKAYDDVLTGLSNRSGCEMTLDRLSREHKRYRIISLDLDHLKMVNDTYGHAEGDRYLKEFAQILQKSFDGATLIGRMGGDEFLVVVTGEDCNRTAGMISRMKHAIEARNKEEKRYQFSVSYGEAQSGESDVGRRSHDVYMLADAKMYDMKRRTH